jgi:TusA-related sulfurtransferase
MPENIPIECPEPVVLEAPPANRHFTHLPLLKAAAALTEGAILELGSGEGSTRALHEICANTGRKLLTVESDWKWYRKLCELRSDFHRFAFVRDWSEAPLLPPVGGRWGVVLVDLAPAPARRGAVARYQGAADIIIAHDTEPKHERLYGYSADLWDRFAYTLHDDRTDCHATALSDTLDVRQWSLK